MTPERKQAQLLALHLLAGSDRGISGDAFGALLLVLHPEDALKLQAFVDATDGEFYLPMQGDTPNIEEWEDIFN